jgi:hypothetical protein
LKSIVIEVPYIAADTEHDRDIPMARELIGILHQAYPGHEWFVLIRGGVVQIKKLEWHANWGMALMYSNLKGDAAARKRDVIRAAGEFLERGNAKRGANTGESIHGVEGIPDKHMRRLTL